jgi:ATP-grasp domain/Carbamoyl-phosphate synthase L chain, ATP binding domain
LPDIIVPLDDVSTWLLRSLVLRQIASLQLTGLIERSLGSADGYPACLTRFEFAEVASRLGLRTPRTARANDKASLFDAAASWGYPIVVKSEFTCGGVGVTIAERPGDLEFCAQHYFPPTSVQPRNYRSRGRDLIWRSAGLFATHNAPPLLQSYVSGKPAMTMAATWRGQVLDSVCFVAEHVHPKVTGSSTLVRHIEHEEMTDTVSRIVAALECSGFMSFDFVLESDTNAAFLIEMNARPIGTGHLGSLFGHDVCGALVSKLNNAQLRPPRSTLPSGTLVALFPKEIERDPENLGRLAEANIYHDIPSDDPELVEAYLDYFRERCPHHIDAVRNEIARLDLQDKFYPRLSFKRQRNEKLDRQEAV